MKTFGQFKQRQKEQRDLGLSSAEKSLMKAFRQGQYAGCSDLPRSSPYRPEAARDKHEAWLCGYDEEAVRYVIRAKWHER